jgi:predicted permease
MFQDLRFAFRMLLKNLSFTAMAALTLALGIGANTAVFSLIDKLLWRTLPVASPEQLVLLSAESSNPHFLHNVFSYPDYVDYRERNQVLSGLLAFRRADLSLGAGDEAEKVAGEFVSGNYFDLLGVKMARGRGFLPAEDQTPGARPVVVLSYGLWQRRFDAAPDLIGRTVTLNEVKLTVVGIAPRGFTGLLFEHAAELWAPVMMQEQLQPGSPPFDARQMGSLRLIGRLKPGVSLVQAQASLDVLAHQIRESYTPPDRRNQPFYERRLLLEPSGQGISALRQQLREPLKLLLAVVGLILLIACANVANLLLARATARRKEIAVRLALGASRARLIRQLLAESASLALLGGALGLLFAPWLTNLLTSFQWWQIRVAQTPLGETLDTRVLGFTLLVSVLAGMIFGLIPALQSSKPDLIPALKEGATLSYHERRANARHLLVIAQVALSVVVLVGAGLLIRSLRHLFTIDPGFKAEGVLIVPVNLPAQKYDEAKGREFVRQFSERLKALPGVQAVSEATVIPLSGNRFTRSVTVEGYQTRRGEVLGVETNNVGPGYHELLGIPIVQGRGFTERDREGAPDVAVINEAFARLYFPGQNPLGKRLNLGADFEVVGVTRDIKYHELTERPLPHFDLAGRQMGFSRSTNLHLRTSLKAASLIPAVRREARMLDPGLGILEVQVLDEVVANSLTTARMAATLTGLFGLIALLLAAVGLYGVTSYTVTQSTREIGVRMALGAQARDVLRLVVGQGMALTVIGLAIGLSGALLLTRLMTSLLFGVSATDPLTFVVIVLLLLGVTLVACYLPARKAAKVDPMEALRHE